MMASHPRNNNQPQFLSSAIERIGDASLG